MSLISVRNFVAPLSNTTHIVTIILVTILFALFRLQGGSMRVDFAGENAKKRERLGEVQNSNASSSQDLDGLLINESSNSRAPAASNRTTNANSEAAVKIPERGRITITAEEGDLLGEMIGKQPLPQQKQPDTGRNRQDLRKDKGGLDEIEKSLGLR